MTTTPGKLNIPVFLLSRRSLRSPGYRGVREQVARHAPQYTACCEESRKDTAERRKLHHVVGLDPGVKSICNTRQDKARVSTRQLYSSKPWHLAPNRYVVPLEPFASLTGKKAAMPRQEKRPPRESRSPWKFYEIKRDPGKNNKWKGVLIANRRKQKPTERIIISSLAGCYRRPTDPHSASYYHRAHEISSKRPTAKTVSDTYYVFHRNSCVPLVKNYMYNKLSSFLPGPGRYETSIRVSCICRRSKRIVPNLQLLIDRANRLKFRRLFYKHIVPLNSCSPAWPHVKGRGWTYLFHNKYVKPKPVVGRKVDVVLYPEGRYIKMLSSPDWQPKTQRRESIKLPPTIRFVSQQRVRKRKPINQSKRVAFGSGRDRFANEGTKNIVTKIKWKDLIANIPIDRRLQDLPVLNVPSEEIVSRLYFIPSHMRPHATPILRKELFKFPPRAEDELLFSADEASVLNPTPFFCKDLDPLNYLKDEASFHSISFPPGNESEISSGIESMELK